jgi:UDP-N-acetyl-alpha-D-muramoyl-L-alanyl-L-glutamate epimerase
MVSETIAGGGFIDRLREFYPVFRVDDAWAEIHESSVELNFAFSVAAMKFQPVVRLHGLRPDEMVRLSTETSHSLIRALAIIEAFSYWKAFCSPTIEVALPPPGADELDWWRSFWPDAMAEFFYRNGIDFTDAGFLDIVAAPARETARLEGAEAHRKPGATALQPVPLVMFSGGKDSLALALMLSDGGRRQIDCFLYNPTSEQSRLAESVAAGGRILRVERHILPELLELNAKNHPNGHTPYSAYLGVAATLVGYLRGSENVVAGNSRSDDEPNIDSYFGRSVNHQWTKTYAFEKALRDYRDRWVPCAPTYSSPFRPLFELQVLSSLSDSIDSYLRTASCNRTKGIGWCGECAKCAWVFLATAALFGLSTAVQKFNADLFTRSDLSELYMRMAGLVGTKPFECTGTEEEVRVAIRAVSRRYSLENSAALAACLRAPLVIGARPLEALLADWGRDDLVPAEFVGQVRRCVAHRAIPSRQPSPPSPQG